MKQRATKKPDFEDDGRVVAPMNVDGMPNSMLDTMSWFGNGLFRKRPDRQAAPRSEAPAQEPLTPRQTRRVIANAVLAALAVAVVFIGAGALLILFCTHVWLR